jgi:hypothetical protein
MITGNMSLKDRMIQPFWKWQIVVSAVSHIKQFHGVVVITPDSESGNLGSNPGGAYIIFLWGRNRQSVQTFGKSYQISIFSLGKNKQAKWHSKIKWSNLFENDK